MGVRLNRSKLLLPVCCAFVSVVPWLATGAVSAQDGAPPTVPDPRRTIPEKIEPPDAPSSESSDPPETLSERLDETEGVIKPPAGVDPQIQVPAPDPDPGTTPVIPPSRIEPESGR